MNYSANPRYNENVILKMTFEFAILSVKYAEKLDKERKFSIANQILRSGTSIGANVKEAQNAESKKDFIHKLKIALKEADEIEYWLFLCEELDTYPSTKNMVNKLLDIQKVINKIISTMNKS